MHPIPRVIFMVYLTEAFGSGVRSTVNSSGSNNGGGGGVHMKSDQKSIQVDAQAVKVSVATLTIVTTVQCVPNIMPS